MSPAPPPAIREAYDRMLAAHGHQDWWPGETPFEVCVGAILTQNTAWRNVERAIANLREADLLDPPALFDLPEAQLVERIRPAGCPRIKARRLRSFLEVLMNECHGSLANLFAGDTAHVRRRLLAIHGIGPETADCLLLYVGGHLSFVVDAYTRRVFARHGWCAPDAGYSELQALCAGALDGAPGPERLDLWRDYHAQIVAVGKEHCRPGAPRCQGCPLEPLLPHRG